MFIFSLTKNGFCRFVSIKDFLEFLLKFKKILKGSNQVQKTSKFNRNYQKFPEKGFQIFLRCTTQHHNSQQKHKIFLLLFNIEKKNHKEIVVK
jgi:hypothetical protein